MLISESCHCPMVVAMETKHRFMKMWPMKHLDSGHQYTPVMEHITCTYTFAIDTCNEQQWTTTCGP